MTDETQPSPPAPDEQPPTEIASPRTAGMTGEELAEARRYGRYELACTLADKGLDVAYLAVAALWLALPIDLWLKDGPFLLDHRWARLLTLFVIVTAGHIGVSMPLSFYAGYLLEHRFGLSTLTVGRWLWRYVKRNLLALGFGMLIMPGLYALIWYTGPLWWLLAAGAFFVVSVLLGRLLPVLILPLFYKIEKLDAPELAERIGRLAEGTGLSIQGVYRMDLSEETVKANAMLAGLGRTRRVLLGDTLLDGFAPEEIEVIFAHEIGHHVLRHIRKMIVAGVLYSTAGFMICDALLTGHVPFAAAEAQYAQMPVHTLPLVMLILTVFAMLLEPLQNAVSRRYERQSDRYALDRTGAKDAYVSAFRKLARLNKDDPDPHPLDVLLFHSHPPIAQRLTMADE
ncbi:MAG TPA: M48 family metallopeptidase, partial [Thermoguttaceae bacterium]|nr:M48 family metallopeptidase [Thermoguttaceae bacterium]